MALCFWMVAKILHFSWRSLLFSQQKLAKKVLILSWSNFIDPCFFGGIGREGSVKDIICYKKRWGGGGNWSAVDVVPVRPNLPPLIHCSLILHTGENTFILDNKIIWGYGYASGAVRAALSCICLAELVA